MTRIVVCGIGGRMGQTLVRLARDVADVEIIAGIDRHVASGEAARALGVERVVEMGAAAAVIGRADVVLDFSAPAATLELVTAHGAVLAGRALAVGTTGLEAGTMQALDRLALEAAVLVASNFSVGVNLLLSLVERAARVLAAEAYDAEIVEIHHGRKVDAPSGTAVSLAAAIARGRGTTLEAVRRDGRSGETGERPKGEIGIHALRGGAVAGRHSVHFLGVRERIELTHEAEDRTLFAEGALAAARWLSGRSTGRYTMQDVLGMS